jgi:hypothetical protein
MTGAILHTEPNALRTPDWLALKLLAPEVAAVGLSAILKRLDSIEEQAFALRGEAMFLIEERNLFRYILDEEVGDYYQSFDKWLKDTLPRSWGYCRDALRARKELRDIPFDDFGHMKRCNIEKLKEVSSSVRLLPEVIQAAKQMPEKQFVAAMNEKFNQHLEVKQPVVMAPADDCTEFETAVEMVMVVDECHSRAEALKSIGVRIIQEVAAEYEHRKEATA